MKVFQSVQKNLKSVGISAERVSFGLYEFVHVLVYILFIVLLCVHTVYVSEMATVRVKSIVMVSVIVLVLITYLVSKAGSKKIFKIIDDLEQAIEKSE